MIPCTRLCAYAALAAALVLPSSATASQENWFIFGQGGIFQKKHERTAAPSRSTQPQQRRAFSRSHRGSERQLRRPQGARTQVASVNRQAQVRNQNFTPAPQFRRQEVSYDGPHKPGTIVVDTGSKFLYHVKPNGKAMRYGIGVGRAGFGWSGTANIARKAEWPSWRPPAAMIAREKKKGRILPTYMAGGPENPLGARALYLYQGGKDTLYRIHGTNEPWSIGQAMSSGCIRMMNDDVTHLYEEVKLGSRVVVL